MIPGQKMIAKDRLVVLTMVATCLFRMINWILVLKKTEI